MALDSAQLLEQAGYLKGNLTDETLYPSTGSPNQIFALSTAKKNVIQAINGLKTLVQSISDSQTANSETIVSLIGDIDTYPELITNMNAIAPEATHLLGAVNALKVLVDLKATQDTTYSKVEVNTLVEAIVASAPNTLNTLKKIADRITLDESMISDVDAKVDTKASASSVTQLKDKVDSESIRLDGAIQTAADNKAQATADLSSAVSTLEIKVDTKSDKITVSTLETKVDTKADKSTVTTLETKVDTKADKSTVTTLETKVDTKADKSTVTTLETKVDTKANQATTYTKTETDSRIQAVVGAAPAALDTLKEIADQLATDEGTVGSLVATVAANKTQAASDLSSAVSTLNTKVDTKADKSTVSTLDTKVDTKADKSTVTTLETKVDTKADKSTVDSLGTTVATKADKSSLDALSTKVDSLATASNVYSKGEVDDKIKSSEIANPGSSGFVLRRTIETVPGMSSIYDVTPPVNARYAIIYFWGTGGGGYQHIFPWESDASGGWPALAVVVLSLLDVKSIKGKWRVGGRSGINDWAWHGEDVDLSYETKGGVIRKIINISGGKAGVNAKSGASGIANVYNEPGVITGRTYNLYESQTTTADIECPSKDIPNANVYKDPGQTSVSEGGHNYVSGSSSKLKIDWVF